ncbi:MAG TPA: hypothetical protein VKA68_04145 [bacterium]|nr:hypothetical protein [bacterium]
MEISPPAQNNPYLDEIYRVLPRLLALYDRDNTSPTYGVGDRLYWAWKVKDFANGTFQGAAHGLARLLHHDLLPDYVSERAVLERIDAMFRGAQYISYPNGSAVEAFPYENSFCVTALVAYDLLTAIEILASALPEKNRTRYLRIVRPMIQFVERSEETHAFISNHLATAAAALYKWNHLTAESGRSRADVLLERILDEQSEDGWYREYEGADPGYQSLATDYLADIHAMTRYKRFEDSLARSLQFLWYFAHPDGSFGGHYGSRNTRFYFPAGIKYLAGEIPEATVLAEYMEHSITRHSVVTLDTLDESNLIPMFNSYCRAAALWRVRTAESSGEDPVLPALQREYHRKRFDEAGLLIDNTPRAYTIVSWQKGGVCYHFSKENGTRIIDTGVVGKSPAGELFSSQTSQPENSLRVGDKVITVEAALTTLHKEYPAPLKFLLLRVLNLTVMRIRWIREFIKRRLVKRLITGRKVLSIRNKRTITLGEHLHINDEWIPANCNLERVEVPQPFSAIHMASQGYWQRQDDSR